LLEAKISSKISFSRLKGRNITVRQATWPLYQLTKEKRSEKLPSMGMLCENMKLHYMSIISALAL
jgi:hypothetical protein